MVADGPNPGATCRPCWEKLVASLDKTGKKPLKSNEKDVTPSKDTCNKTGVQGSSETGTNKKPATSLLSFQGPYNQVL